MILKMVTIIYMRAVKICFLAPCNLNMLCNLDIKLWTKTFKTKTRCWTFELTLAKNLWTRLKLEVGRHLSIYFGDFYYDGSSCGYGKRHPVSFR